MRGRPDLEGKHAWRRWRGCGRPNRDGSDAVGRGRCCWTSGAWAAAEQEARSNDDGGAPKSDGSSPTEGVASLDIEEKKVEHRVDGEEEEEAWRVLDKGARSGKWAVACCR